MKKIIIAGLLFISAQGMAQHVVVVRRAPVRRVVVAPVAVVRPVPVVVVRPAPIAVVVPRRRRVVVL